MVLDLYTYSQIPATHTFTHNHAETHT